MTEEQKATQKIYIKEKKILLLLSLLYRCLFYGMTSIA
jgi:hypothetical protein